MLGKYLPPPWCPYKNDPNWQPGYRRLQGMGETTTGPTPVTDADLKVQVEKLNLELAAQNQTKGYSMFIGLAGVAAKIFDVAFGGKGKKKGK